MTLYESLLQIKPIPEVEEAVYKLINSKGDSSAYFYYGETWFDEGKPLIQLHRFVEEQSWEFLLDITTPTESRLDHIPSPYTKFRYSRYSPFFDDGSKSMDEKSIEVSVWLNMDVEAASRLISYYLRCFEFDDKIKDCIEIVDYEETEYDE